MMARTIYALFFSLSVVLLYGDANLPAVAQADASAQQWQKRANATADSPNQARKVILDALFSGQALTVASAYEQAMRKNPASQERIANFAWAAMMAEPYCQPGQSDTFGKMVGRAVKALRPFIERIRDVGNAEQQKQWATFRESNVPTAWLAWGHFLCRFCFDKAGAQAAFQHALALDPKLAEAYYEQAQMVTSPYDTIYFQSHQSKALLQLNKAEQLEPALHPLIVSTRAYIALDGGDTTQGATYLREYLQLWPGAPYADRLRQDIATFDKTSSEP